MRPLLIASLVFALGCSSDPAATTRGDDANAADATARADSGAHDVVAAAETSAEVTGTGGSAGMDAGGGSGGAGGSQASDAAPAGTGGASDARTGSGGAGGAVADAGGGEVAPAYPLCTKPTAPVPNWLLCYAKANPMTGFSDPLYSKIGHLFCQIGCLAQNTNDCVADAQTLCVRSCGDGACQ
jgi:hypothetical protein